MRALVIARDALHWADCVFSFDPTGAVHYEGAEPEADRASEAPSPPRPCPQPRAILGIFIRRHYWD